MVRQPRSDGSDALNANRAAYIAHHTTDALSIAERWVVGLAATQGTTPVLDVPDLSVLEQQKALRAFVNRFPVVTWPNRDFGPWKGGPILSVYPDRRRVGELSAFRRGSGLCVVAWRVAEVADWVAASQAVKLDPEAGEENDLPPLDPVVVQALLTLGRRVNWGCTAATPHDRTNTLSWFRTLHRAGLRLQPDALYAHALVSGWSARGAHGLRDLATRLEAGERLKGSEAASWATNSVEVWRHAAQAVEGLVPANAVLRQAM